jgi:hypothetical protein
VAGRGGTIFKTTDGGLSWVEQSSSLNVDFYDIFFLNPTYGYVVGSLGAIYKTTNGGLTWTKQESGTTGDLRSVWFTSKSKGYICGYQFVGNNGVGHVFGIVLKTTNGGDVGINNDYGNEHIEISTFPNPVENELSLAIKTTKKIKLSADLYTITGQRISTLVNTDILPGSHIFPVKRRGLPSGVYIISFRTENEVLSRKVVFL